MDMHTVPADTTTIKTGRQVWSDKFKQGSTFLALLIGYAGYYLCRQNFSVALIPMREQLGISAMQLGSLASFGTLLYAFGKFSTGALADTLGGKRIFLLGLWGSVLASIFFGLSHSLFFLFLFWGLNRFFQSMGWAGLVNLVSQWFSKKNYGTAMGLMSLNYQFGGVLATVFAGSLLSAGVWFFFQRTPFSFLQSWQYVFLIPALALAIIGIFSQFFIFEKYEKKQNPQHGSLKINRRVSYLSKFSILFSNPKFALMCLISLVLTFLRECFGLWMPVYFAEFGASLKMAAFQSALFPALGCLGTLFSGWYSDRYLSARREPVMMIFLFGLTVSILCLSQVEFCALKFGVAAATLRFLFVGLSGFFLLGPYSLIGGVIALDIGGTQASGTAAGVLDGVGYLGASFAGVGVARLVMHSGWQYAFFLMAMSACISLLLCGLHLRWGLRQSAK